MDEQYRPGYYHILQVLQSSSRKMNDGLARFMRNHSTHGNNTNTKKTATCTSLCTWNHRPTTVNFLARTKAFRDDDDDDDDDWSFSCQHLSDMACVEKKLTQLGFCNIHCRRGLIPERFLPSFVTFTKRVVEFEKHAYQSAALGPGLGQKPGPGLGPCLGRGEYLSSARTAVLKSRTRPMSNVTLCSRCGCYTWEEPHIYQD